MLALASITLSCHHGTSDRPLVPDARARFHVADRLGSAALVLDNHGRVVARDAADPYGTPRLTWRAEKNTAAPLYRFTDKEDDPLSGAVAIGARHYLPALGRWTSPDPHFLLDNPDAAFSTPAEANPYGYVGGNPVTFTDPTGKKGLAHGHEHRPGVLDNYPDSPNTGFGSRMAAVAHERALAELRSARLTSAALGVLDFAMSAVDWAFTASDAYDTTAALAAGPVGVVGKGGKSGAKLALRQARKAVKNAVRNAVKAAMEAAERVASLAKPGRARRNAHLAGQKHPGTGVPFNADGYPDFSKVSKKDVQIEFTGDRARDARAANKAAGFDKTPDGYQWHHHQDGKTMQLVPASAHRKTGHDGGFSGH